jgi:hypothetical protein
MTAGASVVVYSAASQKPNFYVIAAGLGTLLFGAKRLEDRLTQLKAKKNKPNSSNHHLSPKIRAQVYLFLEAHQIDYKDCNVTTILENLRAFQREIREQLAEQNQLKRKKCAEITELAAQSPAAAAALLIKLSM